MRAVAERLLLGDRWVAVAMALSSQRRWAQILKRGIAPPRGKFGDKARRSGGGKTRCCGLTFSNFSMVRLSIPPHL